MRVLFRALGVIVIIYAVVMALMGLRYIFDQGDLRKASQIIQQFKLKGSDKTLMALMSDRLGIPEAALFCEPHMLSRYGGRIEVDCRGPSVVLASKKDNGVTMKEFRFEVDIVTAHLRALDEDAIELLAGDGDKK